MTNTFVPLNDFYVRRVGRPSKEWLKQMVEDVCALFGSVDLANDLAADKLRWQRIVSQKLGY